MKSYQRICVLIALDAVLINLALILSLVLRFFGSESLLYYIEPYLTLAPVITVFFLVGFYGFNLYNRLWAYASLGELKAIVQAVTVGSLGTIALTYFIYWPLPRSVVFMNWAFIIILVGGSRLAWRVHIEHSKRSSGKPVLRALIIGAGDAGAMVARELKGSGNIRPVGFIDDDPRKQRQTLLGLPVLGSREAIGGTVKRKRINLIIIAMPSADSRAIREIVEICRETGVELKILPGMYQLINGHVSVSHLRPVQLEDLLHRDPVRVDLEEIAGYLKGETVLITGAGGSIGSELCRQVALFSPGRLVLLGHGENSIHKIGLELQEKFKNIPLDLEIIDVRDKSKVKYIFMKYRPGVVFHAAAHKHLPLMELHPDEALKTNVFGTRNVSEAADRAGVKIFVMISTDKAVNPSSVMGATKRMAELIIQQKNSTSATIFTAVRFGNVLGSNGSVVPIFQRQIAAGGPVTVTDPDMKRYFMTIPEAVQLVIQAGAIAGGGEVFVLDMGDPVKIVDLATDMIKFSGLEPGKDIDIKFTGIRPGEKLFEELLTAEEGSHATKHKRIFVARPSPVEISALETLIAELFQKGHHCTRDDILRALSALLPGFAGYQRGKVG